MNTTTVTVPPYKPTPEELQVSVAAFKASATKGFAAGAAYAAAHPYNPFGTHADLDVVMSRVTELIAEATVLLESTMPELPEGPVRTVGAAQAFGDAIRAIITQRMNTIEGEN